MIAASLASWRLVDQADELAQMRKQMAEMQKKLDEISK